MTAPTVRDLARQGDAAAIAMLINRSLNPQAITAAVRINNNCLEILLEALTSAPAQSAMVERIRKGLIALEVPIQQVQLHGRQTGAPFPDWSVEIDLQASISVVEANKVSSGHPQPISSQENPKGLVARPRLLPQPPRDVSVIQNISSAPAIEHTPKLSTPLGQPISLGQIVPLSSVPSVTRAATKPVPFKTRGTSRQSTARLQLKLGSLVLVDIPVKNRRTLGITIAIVAIQTGMIGLGLILWGQSAYQTVTQRPSIIRSTNLPVASFNPNKVYQASIKYRHHGIPVIDVTFNHNQTFEMIVDTGASGTLITQEMAIALQVQPMGWVKIGVADGRVVQLPTGVINAISVNGATVKNVPVVIASGMPIGLLGHDFFDGFDIKINRDTVEFYPRQSK